jgi:Zn-dependent protease
MVGVVDQSDPKSWMNLLLLAPPLLLSLTVHEYAHARTALAFGDPTAKLMGRVTLNPLAHLDPIGTLCLLFSGIIGWARPVPVNPANLRPPRLGDIMVSVAGPMSNLLLAVLCGLALRGLDRYANPDTAFFRTAWLLLWYTTVANLGLCAFNMIPLYPLDGHHVARELLPAHRRAPFMNWQVRYGSPLLMALIFIPVMVRMATGRRVPFDPIAYIQTQFIERFLSILVS